MYKWQNEKVVINNMAKFLIQNDKSILDNEKQFLLEKLEKQKYVHEYRNISFADLYVVNEPGWYPVGTIQFVSKYLHNAYDIEQENPIEIPEYLRTEEFLKREYYFTTFDKLPRTGKYFLKDCSQLKKFSEAIIADYFPFNEKKLSTDHIYQVSSLFPVEAEYRVYVLQGEIENIVCYDGDCTVLSDMALIKKAITIINAKEKWLKSYTIDVMVGKPGTAIIEIHNFMSVGLYSTLWGDNLVWAYKDGIDYLINDNHKLIV